MPITRLGNLLDNIVAVNNPVAGTPAGSHVSIPAPYRGRLMEVGFTPNSGVTSGMTLLVAINNSQLSATASTFVQCLSSTDGTFSSTALYDGATVSAVPPSPTFFNQGDAISFTTSGGQSSTVGATLYAVLRKG